MLDFVLKVLKPLSRELLPYLLSTIELAYLPAFDRVNSGEFVLFPWTTLVFCLIRCEGGMMTDPVLLI